MGRRHLLDNGCKGRHVQPVRHLVAQGAGPGRQRAVIAANRFGIPAIAHEECLTGFTAFLDTLGTDPEGGAE